MGDIKVGDLVGVLNRAPCCGAFHKLHGLLFVAQDVYITNKHIECYCGFQSNGMLAIKMPNGESVVAFVCKKIPPLSELEDVTTKTQDLIPNEKEKL